MVKKNGLPKAKTYWNFIQSSTIMAVEKTFGILKEMQKILLKRIDMPLWHLPNLVTIYIYFHSLCIMYRDKFDDEHAKEREKFMHKESINQLGKLQNANMFMAATQATKKMRKYLKIDKVEVGTVKIEDLEETVVYAFENVKEDEDDCAEVV